MDLLPGQLPEYEEDKKRRLGEEGAKPKRIRYKPISGTGTSFRLDSGLESWVGQLKSGES